MLRIAQLNDTHEGITKRTTINRLLLELKEKEQFDILLHCGDYSGGSKGWKLVRSTISLIRSVFPDVPFVSLLGNHDYWCGDGSRKIMLHGELIKKPGYPSPEKFWENYANVLKTFTAHKVWFLDEQGPYRHGDYTIAGHSGWYGNGEIVSLSNDFKYLPYGMEGDTQSFMLKRAMDGLWKNMDKLNDDDMKRTLIFASHFPVIKTREYDHGFDQFSWSASLGEALHTQYGINYFFNGHAHQHHTGPLRWETGSDYYKPEYQIVEIP